GGGVEGRLGVEVLEGYGAMEGGLAFRPPGVGPPGSFGKPVPGLDMRIVDEHDAECPPGVVGEIVSRPATGEPAQVEYFRNPVASKAKTALAAGFAAATWATATGRAGSTSTTARAAASVTTATSSTPGSSRS